MKSRDEVIWAAGFFDGEGTTGTRTQRGHTYLVLQVAQVDRRPLDRFGAAVGVGKVYGPYANPGFSKKTRPIHKVAILGKNAHLALNLLKPFLTEAKLEQAGLALARAAESSRGDS
jgi:hypothetical protein